VGLGGAFISLLMSRWMAKMAMGVQLVDGRTGQAELDWLYQTVEQLTRKVGLPMPEVGIYEPPEVNAFATGSSNAAASSRLEGLCARCVEKKPKPPAHEVSHIQNGDMVTMTLIQGVVNAFTLFFSRVIANIIRQLVDERISHLVFFISTIVFDIVFSLLGMVVVGWFSRARSSAPMRAPQCLEPRQHDRRAAAPGRKSGPGRSEPAAAGDDEDQRRQAHRPALADGDPPAARRAHRRPSARSVGRKGTCYIFTVSVNERA
jgi:hypothetical protein